MSFILRPFRQVGGVACFRKKAEALSGAIWYDRNSWQVCHRPQTPGFSLRRDFKRESPELNHGRKGGMNL